MSHTHHGLVLHTVGDEESSKVEQLLIQKGIAYTTVTKKKLRLFYDKPHSGSAGDYQEVQKALQEYGEVWKKEYPAKIIA